MRKNQYASRSKSSKRTSAKRVQRRSNKSNESEGAVTPESYPIAPDHVEVIESGTSSKDLARYLYLPPPRSQPPLEAPDADPNSLNKRKGVKIDESRALQIQQALKQRGFYTGELTGEYDQSTVEAMRNFQTQEKIPVTGYPTAHALKRLGLASW